MATFQIQNNDGSFSPVSHDEFFEALNANDGADYAYYRQGGKHIALIPTEENQAAVNASHYEDNAESGVTESENRCRDEKGLICRYQHDESGIIIRNSKGLPVYAKCGDCPRNGWIAGKRENCCIRNYCKVESCVYCPHPRECHSPHSYEWLTESKSDDGEGENGGLFIVDPNADIQSALENEELESALRAAIEELPAKERAVLKAIYWDKLSQRAYAVETGMSRSVVKRLHDHALESLKKKLKNFR